MIDLKSNYYSIRSDKARIGVKFNEAILVFLSILTVLILLFGIWLIFIGLSLGWVMIGFAVVPAMIVEWYNGELRDLKPKDKPQTIDDLISADVLGVLSKDPTPREVVNITGNTLGGRFMMVRFGIGNGFLQEIVSDNREDMKNVWQEAYNLREQTNSPTITAVILVVALIKTAPHHSVLLNHLQLDMGDLIFGISWYNHLCDLIAKRRLPRKTGGLARDWSFGYTPLLNRFGQNISQRVSTHGLSLVKLVAHEDCLERLVDIFSKNGRQNAVLVGPVGVGKTEIINALAARLLDGLNNLPSNLQYHQVFMLDAASLVAAAPNRGDLEHLLPRILGEAYRAKNIIICLDNAQLFFEDTIGSVDISNVLLPILDAGSLRIIMAMDEQQYLRINKRKPELANILNRINVDQATREETITVMQDRSIMTEFQNKVTFMHQALLEAYRLCERYVYDLAMPGKAISLLETAARYSENGLVTAASVRQAVESNYNVKVGVATDEDEREKLLNMEDLIHKRMINQSKAVKVISDALRRARVGVRNQNRPVGTFLFLGPTGVGKTELSKSLAAIYFGDENSMIRLDMNEYSKASDVDRLIADGTDNSTSLTAQVMKQPFSVILLDEIEKAHQNVVSALLQMLDEGILRDVNNREVSFRDAIVIATSNAGADRIREYIDRGYDVERFEDKFVDELISSNQFRPEFLNRFDEIVMFRPLNKDELLQVVDLMLDNVNKTLALQKISVKVTDDAKKYLVDAGYDPRLGARPMRRVIQRSVENTIARQMLSGSVGPGSEVEVDLAQIKQILEPSVNFKQLAGEEN